MNTAKQVNIMIGLLFVGLFGTFLYVVWENGIDIFGAEIDSRQEVAAERQEKTNVERGAHLFSLNCRSCHGLKGEGVIERGGLPGAPLNVAGLRPPELTGGTLQTTQQRFRDTITCGRVGTVMPPWHIEQGGPLNDFQITQLVTLITSEFALEGWEFGLEESNRTDEFDVRKHLTEPVAEGDDVIHLDNVEGLEVTEDAPLLIRLGGETLEDPYEVLEVLVVNEDDNTLEVERGTDELGTEPLEHEAGLEVYEGPIAPGTTITGDPDAQGAPPCGQRPAAPQASPDGEDGGDAETVALTDGLTVDMGDNFFEVDGVQNPTFTLAAGETVTVTLENIGSAIHNMAAEDQVSDPDTIPGGDSGEIELTFDDPGTYEYLCEFHPTDMLGEIVVE